MGADMLKVLSIDGGGIRGVIPAVILEYIERKTGKPIASLFDIIVGTSTGGILACGLATPGTGGQPKLSAADMLGLYAERGKDIFERSFWRGLTSVGGLTEETYDHRPLERLLKQYLGDATLADALVPLVVTAYDIERRQPYFFKSTKAKQSKDRNHYLRDAARATSAAPTFFQPEVVRSMAKRSTRRALIDGGVFVNNPSMCAYVEAQELPGAKDQDMLMISIGTGVATRKIDYEDAKGWGALGWVRPIISIMMDGEADAADYHMSELLPNKAAGKDQRYFRFDTELDVALDDMDAASSGNIMALKAEAEQILHGQKSEMARAIAKLTAA